MDMMTDIAGTDWIVKRLQRPLAPDVRGMRSVIGGFATQTTFQPPATNDFQFKGCWVTSSFPHLLLTGTMRLYEPPKRIESNSRITAELDASAVIGWVRMSTFLPPQEPSQSYYWTKEWQEAEHEALEEHRRGESIRFDRTEDAIRWLTDD